MNQLTAMCASNIWASSHLLFTLAQPTLAARLLPSNSLLGPAKDGRGSAGGAPHGRADGVLRSVQNASDGFYPERLFAVQMEWTGLGERGTPDHRVVRVG